MAGPRQPSSCHHEELVTVKRRLAKGSLVALLAIAISSASSAVAANAPIQAHYECLWWSSEQMIHLDPNHPPEKRTPTRIDHWEYTDPIGVPHPDVVTLVIEVPADTKGDVSVGFKWLISGKWVASATRAHPAASLAGDGSRTFRVDVRVKESIEERKASRLRAVILVDGKTVKNANLPIQLGD